MKLETLTREQVQQVRKWRNAEPQFLRTPYMITEKMQDEFFDNVINDRDSKHRYFAIMGKVEIIEPVHLNLNTKVYKEQDIKSLFIGMCGLTNIEWENGTAEISLIINPDYRGKGDGKKSVNLLLNEAFFKMRLFTVYGEVYDCGHRKFWENITIELNGYKTDLVNRKWWNGKLYGSMWFSIKGGEVVRV